MPDRVLRDNHNKHIGTIKTLSDGKQEIRDPHNKKLGTYDPKRNETRDASNRLVGKGNLLTTLL
ncbi:MAG: hypothetical protein GXY83_11270 [Rhodopirellula sp.]|nr:hypothetical protein [Rhodopirellula sp.]